MQAVDRISVILREICRAEHGITLTELSDAVLLPKSTLHRILRSLERERFVYQDDDTKRFRLGSEILLLGSRALNQIDIADISRPHMESLFKQLDETIFLSVFEKDRVVCVHRIEQVGRAVRYFVKVGAVMPFHCSAAGKAVLAYQPNKTVKSILQKCDYMRYTPLTMTDPNLLMEELERTRRSGYAVCDREMEPLVRAISAPVLRHDGTAIASITCVGLIDQFKDTFVQQVAESIVECAARASEQLQCTNV